MDVDQLYTKQFIKPYIITDELSGSKSKVRTASLNVFVDLDRKNPFGLKNLFLGSNILR